MSARPQSLDEIIETLRADIQVNDQAERIARMGSFVVDTRTNEFRWSRELKRMNGMAPDEPASLEIMLDRLLPEDRARMLRYVEELTTPGDILNWQHPIHRPNGSVIHVHARGELLEMPGYDNPVFIGTVRDITEQHRAQERIAAQEEELVAARHKLILLAQEGAMATMGSTLAHEMNQPLTTISNYAEVLKRMPITTENAGEIAGIAMEISRGAIRAAQVVRRMRDLIQRGAVNRESTPIDEVVLDACRHFKFATNVRVELDLAATPAVPLDPIQIEQVLVNLIRNAIEASAGHPCPEVLVTTVEQDGALQVVVSDKGTGIPESALPDFFESRPSTKASGMGVGLSICRTIVQAHGGRIWARNGEEGAQVGFSLPLEVEESDSGEGSRESGAGVPATGRFTSNFRSRATGRPAGRRRGSRQATPLPRVTSSA